MERLINIFDQAKYVIMEDWMSILISIVIVIIFRILSPVFAYAILKIVNFKKKKSEIKQISFYKPLKLIFFAFGLYVAAINLQLPEDTMLYVNKIFKIIIIALVAKGFLNMANPESSTFRTLQDKLNVINNKNATGFICKVIKAIVYLIAGFLIITELGYNLNGLVAGLGIGSAILALAVQDVVKNLFGGITILMDKTFLVGDFIEADGHSGNVVDITFRSTKIRTLDNTEVTIPNGILATTYVENWARMEKRRVEVNLMFDHDVKYEQLERVKTRIELVLNEYPNVIKGSVHINYTEIEKEGIKLYIYLYTNKAKYDEYLEVKGQINEVIKSIIEKENVSLELKDHVELLK